MTPLTDLTQALAKLQTANRIDGTRASYRKDSPVEYLKVIAYLQGGARPSGVVSDMGLGLMLAEDARRGLVVTPPPPPPPTGGTRIPASGVIPSAGVWYGDPHVGTVRLGTTDPVTVTGRVNMLSGGGTLIDALVNGSQLTLDHLHGVGKLIVPSNESPTRFAWIEKHKSFVARNCTMENTAGIEVNGALPGGTLLVTRNRSKNIQGYVDNAAGVLRVGNFIQFRVVQGAGSMEVSWNEIVNEYDKSWPEDIFSLYHTSGVRAFDNMLWHQSTPGNARSVSSQGSITVDSSTPGPGCHRNYIARTQVVDAFGIVLYVTAGGDDNLIEDCRIVGDGKLPNGQQIGNGYGSPLGILQGGQRNHAHGCVVGYIDKDGNRYPLAQMLAGAAEGAAAEAAKNTYMPDPITKATEDNEWVLWQAKLAAAGVVVGA